MTNDILLLFPPQWSPFQPALSLPSLSAWLKRAGYTALSLDLNILFYEWLLSDECADHLIELARNADRPLLEKRGYLAVFENVPDFRADLSRLRTPWNSDRETHEEYVIRSYLSVESLGTYLHAISEISGDFIVSPYEFRLNQGNLNSRHLQNMTENPPRILKSFAEAVFHDAIEPLVPDVVGLSCIGQEQTYFTFLLGRLVKAKTESQVLVGGTILSRMFERGAVRADWFGRYFDVIVRNEGERPTEAILANHRGGRPLTDGVPSIVSLDAGKITSAPQCAPLGVEELPIPDFDDTPLGRYLSPEITLPLLSARGCYWGKCEFCHHGMVYGEKYAAYKPYDVLTSVRHLADRYSVRHFAFNDEALPPRIVRAIGKTFPDHADSGWTFTGLIKFEKSYSNEDFAGLQRKGFRSLYVGLESASERVLRLMRKPNSVETIERNLKDATDVGLWMHCFLFFGFPGEAEEDAAATYRFIVDRSDIVSSFGVGTFSLEHNAPIFSHVEDFGAELRSNTERDMDVYYEYEVTNGVSAPEALVWQERLQRAARDIPAYTATNWVPREMLLCLLSVMSANELIRIGPTMRANGGLPGIARLADFMTTARADPHRYDRDPEETVVLNRVNGRVTILKGAARELFSLCERVGTSAEQLQEAAPVMFEQIAFFLQDRPQQEDMAEL